MHLPVGPRVMVVALMLTGAVSCAPVRPAGSQQAGASHARGVAGTTEVTEAPHLPDATSGTANSPGSCEAWAASTAADATGGAATPLAAAQKSSNFGEPATWVLLGRTDRSANFISTDGAADSRVTVSRLVDGTWMATEGQRCTRVTDEPTVAAVIESVTLTCAPRGVGFVVKTRVRWSPKSEVSAWLYDENDQAIGTQLLTAEDTSIGVPSLVPVRIEIRTRDGIVVAEHPVAALPAHSYCLDHPDTPTEPPPSTPPAR